MTSSILPNRPGRSRDGAGGHRELFGLGLRLPHHAAAARGESTSDWFEIISENFLGCGGAPRATLLEVRAHYALALHGVSMSLGSVDPLDDEYLRDLAELVALVEPMHVSDHLCWTGVAGVNTHELLPLPYTDEAFHHVAARIDRVQEFLHRPLLVENVSTYLQLAESSAAEWQFLDALAARTGCRVLLDINNVYVGARNHGFDPRAFLRGLAVPHVAEFHLAGHDDYGTHVVDTHAAPVADPVWILYEEAVRRFGPLPTLLERDDVIPPLRVLEAELDTARERAAGVKLRDVA